MWLQMDFQKRHSLKYSLFRYLAAAVVFSVVCSGALRMAAGQITQDILLRYVEDKQMLYDLQNQYSEAFGDGIPVPQLNTDKMERTDRIWLEICDFTESWSILILTFFSIFIALTLFYNRRLKRPFFLLNDGADRVKRQELDFSVVYDERDEMGQLCTSFEQMRRELKANHHRMWQMIEEQRQMRSAFSHDLRTPLAVLRGYVEYLIRYCPEGKISQEKQMEIFRDLSGQLKRIEVFCDMMKRANRLDDLEVTKKAVSADTLYKKIQVILDVLAEQYEKQYIIRDGIQGFVLCIDLDICLQIVENLASNAMRYAKDLVILTLESDGERLCIRLLDDGPGFAEEELEQAKRPYYHGTDAKEHHYGMGLYICDKLCQKHGGTLRLSNVNGGGCAEAEVRIEEQQ